MDTNSESPQLVANETLKLILDKALLESEARSTARISTTLTDQNVVYMNKIVENAKDIGKLTVRVDAHDEKIKGFKGMIGYIGAASVALGGLLGFFIAQLTGGR